MAGPTVVRPKDELEAMTPAERLKALRRLQAIQRGRIKVPMRCGWCQSSSIEPHPDRLHERGNVLCAACGRVSGEKAVHRARQLEIEAIVIHGELK